MIVFVIIIWDILLILMRIMINHVFKLYTLQLKENLSDL